MTAPLDEVARLVAYVFATTGRRRISEEDWVRVVSLERQWLTPSKARQVADAARGAGFLRNAGARDYEMGLEAEGLRLPLDYRPLEALVEAAVAGAHRGPAQVMPLFRRVVRAISAKTGEGEAAVVAKINQSPLSGHGLIPAEIAAVAFAKGQGVDVDEFLRELEPPAGP